MTKEIETAEVIRPSASRLIEDPDLLEAAGEVDHTLLDWTRGLSPLERLRACTNATKGLSRFQRDPSKTS